MTCGKRFRSRNGLLFTGRRNSPLFEVLFPDNLRCFMFTRMTPTRRHDQVQQFVFKTGA